MRSSRNRKAWTLALIVSAAVACWYAMAGEPDGRGCCNELGRLQAATLDAIRMRAQGRHKEANTMVLQGLRESGLHCSFTNGDSQHPGITCDPVE